LLLEERLDEEKGSGTKGEGKTPSLKQREERAGFAHMVTVASSGKSRRRQDNYKGRGGFQPRRKNHLGQTQKDFRIDAPEREKTKERGRGRKKDGVRTALTRKERSVIRCSGK